MNRFFKEGVLADGAIYDIAQALSSNFGWLDSVFGRTERVCNVINGRKYYSPNYFINREEYIQVLPDDNKGNYCFFYLHDPQQSELNHAGRQILYRTTFSLVVWLDFRSIYDYYGQRNSELVKQDILNFLNNKVFLKNGSFSIDRVYERAENVWTNYTIDETENQFMVSPFGGFRFEGELILKSNCETL